MNLFLTSAGFQDFQTKKIRRDMEAAFRKQCGDFGKKKACYLYTVRSESDKAWLDLYDKEFRALGLPYEAVNISEDFNGLSLPEYDIYYVSGGNTFYILDRLRKTQMDEVLKESVRRGKIYIGVSAGSILACPDISIAGIETGDENDIHLSDLTGFSWVPFYISPHYGAASDRMAIEKFFKEKQKPIIALTDNQMIMVTEAGIKLVGEKDGIQLGSIHWK